MPDKRAKCVCVLTPAVTWMWCWFMTTVAATADILIFLNARVCLHQYLPIFANICKVILFYICVCDDVKEQGYGLFWQDMRKWTFWTKYRQDTCLLLQRKAGPKRNFATIWLLSSRLEFEKRSSSTKCLILLMLFPNLLSAQTLSSSSCLLGTRGGRNGQIVYQCSRPHFLSI